MASLPHEGLEDVSKFPDLFLELLRRGYTEADSRNRRSQLASRSREAEKSPRNCSVTSRKSHVIFHM